MSLFFKRIVVISFLLVTIVLSSVKAWATVYVYEVTTETTRFQTASKLPPDAFLLYNGGYDIIYDLKILATYADKDIAQAMKDYNLEKNNSNNLIHTPVPRNVPKKPYYWWR